MFYCTTASAALPTEPSGSFSQDKAAPSRDSHTIPQQPSSEVGTSRLSFVSVAEHRAKLATLVPRVESQTRNHGVRARMDEEDMSNVLQRRTHACEGSAN